MGALFSIYSAAFTPNHPAPVRWGITGVTTMIHMNHQPRYQMIWSQIVTVYLCRGGDQAHYVAGMIMGGEIQQGLSDLERHNLKTILNAARYADR